VIVTPASGRRAFVSSPWASGDDLTADERCNADADANGLLGSYAALLATRLAGAAAPFDASGQPWVRIDGIPLAQDAAAFLGSQLEAALSIRADGTYGDDRVWTGSVSGGLDQLGSHTCEPDSPPDAPSWTTPDTTNFGATSNSGRGNFSFFSRQAGLTHCNPDGDDGPTALYCLEL
jgi:hypothetical protein